MDTSIACTLATWQPGMADLSGTDKITLANITVEAEGIGPQIRGALQQEMTRIFPELCSCLTKPRAEGLKVSTGGDWRLHAVLVGAIIRDLTGAGKHGNFLLGSLLPKERSFQCLKDHRSRGIEIFIANGSAERLAERSEASALKAGSR